LIKEEVVIIGGGIAGLTAAYALKKQGLDPLVLESSNRLGGRIYTRSGNNQLFELGATWVFEDVVLRELITELGLELYPQYLDGDALIKYDPVMAIQRSPTHTLIPGPIYHKVIGGTGAIIQALAHHLNEKRILLNSKVERLNYQDDQVELSLTNGATLLGKKVILAVPPAVIADHITITPQLDTKNLLSTTHTWMGDSAKFTVLLDHDLWRGKNLSGFAYSNYGLIREIQDHTVADENIFGLLGFLQPTRELATNRDKRKDVAMQELSELFGISESDVLGYDDFLWSEHFVDENQRNYNESLLPHQNNGHSFFLKPHFDHHLFFAGAETSPVKPGYMEGAVRSAYRAVQFLLDSRG